MKFVDVLRRAAFAAQVRVAVDESGQTRLAGQVDFSGSRRRLRAGGHFALARDRRKNLLPQAIAREARVLVARIATRREVERSMGEATRRLQTQAEAARTQLERDADVLATTIVERVLGRKAS